MSNFWILNLAKKDIKDQHPPPPGSVKWISKELLKANELVLEEIQPFSNQIRDELLWLSKEVADSVKVVKGSAAIPGNSNENVLSANMIRSSALNAQAKQNHQTAKQSIFSKQKIPLKPTSTEAKNHTAKALAISTPTGACTDLQSNFFENRLNTHNNILVGNLSSKAKDGGLLNLRKQNQLLNLSDREAQMLENSLEVARNESACSINDTDSPLFSIKRSATKCFENSKQSENADLKNGKHIRVGSLAPSNSCAPNSFIVDSSEESTISDTSISLNMLTTECPEVNILLQQNENKNEAAVEPAYVTENQKSARLHDIGASNKPLIRTIVDFPEVAPIQTNNEDSPFLRKRVSWKKQFSDLVCYEAPQRQEISTEMLTGIHVESSSFIPQRSSASLLPTLKGSTLNDNKSFAGTPISRRKFSTNFKASTVRRSKLSVLEDVHDGNSILANTNKDEFTAKDSLMGLEKRASRIKSRRVTPVPLASSRTASLIPHRIQKQKSQGAIRQTADLPKQKKTLFSTHKHTESKASLSKWSNFSKGTLSSKAKAKKAIPAPEPEVLFGKSIDQDTRDELAATRIMHEWAKSPNLEKILLKQQNVNLGELFGPIPPLKMDEIFKK